MKKYLSVIPLVFLLCFVVGCQDKAAMAELEKSRAQAKVEQQNAELYRKLNEAWNKSDYEYMLEAMAPDYVFYFPSGNPKPASREESLEGVKQIKEGFPDAIWTIEELVAVGDMVITRNIVRATHTGPFQGLPPTGNKTEISIITMTRMKDGKIIEEREDADILGLMMQLGMELKPKEVGK